MLLEPLDCRQGTGVCVTQILRGGNRLLPEPQQERWCEGVSLCCQGSICTDQKRISPIQGLGELSRSQGLCVAYKFGHRISLVSLWWNGRQSVRKSPFPSLAIGTSCGTIKADSSPEGRHAFTNTAHLPLERGPAALLLASQWLLLFQLISQGEVWWLLPMGQESTGRWGQKSYGPFSQVWLYLQLGF